MRPASGGSLHSMLALPVEGCRLRRAEMKPVGRSPGEGGQLVGRMPSRRGTVRVALDSPAPGVRAGYSSWQAGAAEGSIAPVASRPPRGVSARTEALLPGCDHTGGQPGMILDDSRSGVECRRQRFSLRGRTPGDHRPDQRRQKGQSPAPANPCGGARQTVSGGAPIRVATHQSVHLLLLWRTPHSRSMATRTSGERHSHRMGKASGRTL